MKQQVIPKVTLESLSAKVDVIIKSLTGAATKDDIKQFSSKKDLRDEIRYLEARIVIKFEKSERKIDDKSRQYRDEILTKEDKVIGELQDMREERTIGNYQTEERLNDHEKRLKKIEQTQYSTTH